MHASDRSPCQIRSLDKTHDDRHASSRRQDTLLEELALPTRLLMAVIRISSPASTIAPLERCVLDTLGRIIDPGQDRTLTLAAINHLCSMISAKTRFRLDIGDKPDAVLSSDEARIVRALDQLATGEGAKVHETLEWVMEPSVRNRFIGAADVLLRSHSFMHPGSTAFDPWPICRTREDQPWTRVESPISHCDRLSISELLILQITRLWVRGVFIGFDSGAALQYLTSHLCVSGLDIMLHKIMLETGSRAIRTFDARCLCCTEVSPDEARLLASLAALADGDIELSREHLLSWLPDSSASVLMQVFLQTMSALHRLPEPLPRRQWDFDDLHERQAEHFLKEQHSRNNHTH